MSDNTYSPSLDNLRSLLAIRAIALLVQIGVLIYVLTASRTTESLWEVGLCLVLIAAFTCFSLWRTTRPWAITDNEFLIQLLVDVASWTALMYFTGGANNPFISYYIVPLVVSAAVLPWRSTWLIALASLLAYSLLLYYYRPFPLFTPHAAMGHGTDANIHTLGMWFNFLFSAVLITYFVVRMAGALRRQEALTAAQREEHLRNDQIMAVASLAAGTAHELGTPLSTMTVLVDEMRQDNSLSEQAREDCELLAQQLQVCKSTLSELSNTAENTSVDHHRELPLDQFVQDVLNRWAVRRPLVRYRFECEQATPAPAILFDGTLGQAVENLLNNAADTDTDEVVINISWNGNQGHINIRDRGPGISPELIDNTGRPTLAVGSSGLGIGLLLSHATVERHGGQITLKNCSDGGVLASLSMPLYNLEAR